MSQVMELARFKVPADRFDQLLAFRPAFEQALRQNFPGLLSLHLVRLDPETFVDVALWESAGQAAHCMENCHTIPEVVQFMGLISEDLPVEHGGVVTVTG